MQPIEQLLTPEQVAAADAEWERRYRRTDPVVFDEATFRPLIDRFYAAIGLEPPAAIAFYGSPCGAAVALDLEEHTGTRPSAEEIAPIMQDWGAHYVRYRESDRYAHDVVLTPADAAFTAYYDAAVAAGHEAEIPQATRDIYPLACQLGHLIVYADLAVVIDRPSVMHLDEEGRFHATDAPALQFRDGWTRGFVHGVPVPRELVRPEVRATWLTPQRILDCANATERRIMLEIFGTERFIQELGAEPIDTSDFGTLYKVEWAEDDDEEEPDEPLVMVRLLNATDEYHHYEKVADPYWVDAEGERHAALPAWVDKSHGPPAGWGYVPAKMRGVGEPYRSTYWLRVPPTITRAREAVAWSFNLPEEQYQPAEES